MERLRTPLLVLAALFWFGTVMSVAGAMERAVIWLAREDYRPAVFEVEGALHESVKYLDHGQTSGMHRCELHGRIGDQPATLEPDLDARGDLPCDSSEALLTYFPAGTRIPVLTREGTNTAIEPSRRDGVGGWLLAWLLAGLLPALALSVALAWVRRTPVTAPPRP
jgi:hypothetical protein